MLRTSRSSSLLPLEGFRSEVTQVVVVFALDRRVGLRCVGLTVAVTLGVYAVKGNF